MKESSIKLKDKIKDNELYKKTIDNRYLAIFLLLFISLVTYNYFNGGITYDLANQDLSETTQFITSFGDYSWVIYIFAIIFEVIIVPIPSLALNITAASYFGPFMAAIMTICATMIGASIAYYIAKYFGHGYIDEMIGEKNKQKFHKNTEKYGHYVLFVLRINPLTSSDAFNYVAGLFAVPFWRFFLSTLIGIAPMQILVSYFGAEFLDSSPFFKFLFIIINSIYILLFLYIILIFWKNRIKKRFEKIKE